MENWIDWLQHADKTPAFVLGVIYLSLIWLVVRLVNKFMLMADNFTKVMLEFRNTIDKMNLTLEKNNNSIERMAETNNRVFDLLLNKKLGNGKNDRGAKNN